MITWLWEIVVTLRPTSVTVFQHIQSATFELTSYAAEQSLGVALL